ncbi:D-alanyl-D-alanine carboxypeptidase family protein [Agrobacterium rubi]|uniref:D-alanyl-D-alanine carboxypeptidase n=1 Tax=Agrobacterium rubi TaxID=28099 RepID=A0AAE7R0Q5_9HYPH|nr:D-alanyl-D-alanine carboxypeptidase family protein [Agrobacterium rubi]NTE89228.1 D-alanyl-D-alanine carboxypeptidase [Agrobacterium rubi]NTF05010.1 D-alanyl-D-alanine carboxypeptidase [Agrobacterium rubi]NTF38780.1 D-alanyl-D-alanine carboxypeptidase [Agrobacterium rubi]OCJ43178.1 penicillin-binding protein [Agrobacterium rubi]QTF99894.1 D-alanyl-D-alanine carboxypeptidase [Agrobacterium rubi]
MIKTIVAGRLWGRLVLVASLLASSVANATPVLVVDTANRQVLYQEDAGVPWYPASTTKLMTALVVFEALRSGAVTLTTPVVMTSNATKQKFLESGLTLGRTMTLEDALFAALTASANDVAVALAEAVAPNEPAFVERMNAQAARLGMTGTHFASPNGLFDKANYTTARDLAILGMEIDRTYPEYSRFFQGSAVIIDGKEVKSNNALLTRFSGTVGMKTGFLCASGRNYVGLATRNGKRIMVVMMGATTERERDERAAQYLTQAFAGQLPPSGPVDAIQNRADVTPQDMRIRLCTDKSVPYEAEREALYPMGLPGHESFLTDQIPGQVRTITTWQTETKNEVPLPTPRPSQQ